ncbi:NACHT domain-containing protein [Dactylosporangium sp. NPDC005572]|uniref:NACHT domain-containing protein n=1 Tax=Dactylosporangium sp. NPDC005572 TaxID=3156889 RepID=UPI0033BB8717
MRHGRLAAGAFVTVVAGIVIFFASRDELGTSDQVASVVGAAAGVASLILAALLARPDRKGAADMDLDGAESAMLDRLRNVVRTEWLDALAFRGISQIDPMPVRYTLKPITSDEPRAGTLAEMVDVFTSLPMPQMLIVGPAGSGKSVLAASITAALLAEERDEQRVPVLVSASSWDVATESFHAFVLRVLRGDYPFLRSDRARGLRVLERSLARGRILPVLDGLDEMSPSQMAKAVVHLSRAAIAGQSMIVTSRVDDQPGRVLDKLADLRLHPLQVDQQIAFLSQSPTHDRGRLTCITEHLRTQPDGVLAEVLATPLMLSLARDIYARPGVDPSRILAAKRARTIETELLVAYVPALYASQPPSPLVATEKKLRPREYSVESAVIWLGTLAKHLRAIDSSDLAWWELPRMVPRSVFVVSVMVSTAVASASVGGLAFGLLAGLASWLSFSLVVGFVSGALAGPMIGIGIKYGGGKPSRRQRTVAFSFSVDPRHHRQVRRLIGGRPRRIIVGLTLGSIVGLAVFLTFVLVNWLVFEESPSVRGALLFGVNSGLVGALAGGLATWMRRPADGSRREPPRITLRRDRQAALVSAAVFGVGGGIAFGMIAEPTVGIIAGVLGAVVIGISGTAWGALMTARVWLALSGRLPLPLFDFLEDAHRRGILRQVGPVWQFKHILLRDELADSRRVQRKAREFAS